MVAFVAITCDADVGEAGTCATRVVGRVGEDIATTQERASRVGWMVRRDGTYRCPWHAGTGHVGTGLL